ncbi:hypothetical protein ACIBCM_25000 [Streptomyces sp. NPDC051018]|uniref:hypothetical protein n=1 Tax=Streptomyces sp. NPDC051018 TaxID=3365639 RepID=UPI0037A9D399
MRTLITRALLWALERVLPERADVLPASPEPDDLWARPWTTPTPHHVRERHTPLRGEDTLLVRPYAPLDDTLRLTAVRPRRVLFYAAGGLPGVTV